MTENHLSNVNTTIIKNNLCSLTVSDSVDLNKNCREAAEMLSFTNVLSSLYMFLNTSSTPQELSAASRGLHQNLTTCHRDLG